MVLVGMNDDSFKGGVMARRGPRGGGPAKRDRILHAAIKIFSHKGFFNSKVSDIAQSAGVADGKARITAGDDALSRLRIFIENHMGLLLREAGLIEVLQVELRQSNKFMKDYVPVKFLEYLDVISEILELGKREGTFRQDLNVTVARRAVFGALDEMALAYVLSRKRKYDPADAASEIYRLFAEGLCTTAQNREGRT